MRSPLLYLTIAVVAALAATWLWSGDDSCDTAAVTPAAHQPRERGAALVSTGLEDSRLRSDPSVALTSVATGSESAATDDALAEFSRKLNANERARIAAQGETVEDYYRYCQQEAEVLRYGKTSLAWQFAMTGSKIGALDSNEMWQRICTNALPQEAAITEETRQLATDVLSHFHKDFFARYRALRVDFDLRLPDSFRFRDMTGYQERERAFWITLDEQIDSMAAAADRSLVALLGSPKSDGGYVSCATLGSVASAN